MPRGRTHPPPAFVAPSPPSSPSSSTTFAEAPFHTGGLDLSSQDSLPSILSPGAAAYVPAAASPPPLEDAAPEWAFHTPPGGTFRPGKEDIAAYLNRIGETIKAELDDDQISMYVEDPTQAYIQTLESHFRIPKTAQCNIPCMVCLLPFARRVGERTINGTKYDYLKCDAAVALHKCKKASHYMCALCPLCMANENIERDIHHSCPQAAVALPEGLTEEEAENYQSILKLGDMCPCLFLFPIVCTIE